MRLADIVAQYAMQPQRSVPEWMLGCFRRRCISFANGESDRHTQVYWLQSRNFTIDLRLPKQVDQLHAASLGDRSPEQLQLLANNEGWVAESQWDGELLSWRGGSSLQLHNRWPEPAQLRRVGNCMMEFAPSGVYVEDWRLQASAPGPLVGLRLLAERDPKTGQQTRRDGGLIVCGDYAAWVLGRKDPIEEDGQSLPEHVAAAVGDQQMLGRLFDFETSMAEGALADGFTVTRSTLPHRPGQSLLDLDGFEWLGDGRLTQTYTANGETCERTFAVDTLEPWLDFRQATIATDPADSWFSKERTTLTRYTEKLF